jgi:hypothetical protein
MSSLLFRSLTLPAAGAATLLLAGCGTASPQGTSNAGGVATAAASVRSAVHATPPAVPTATTVAASPVPTYTRKQAAKNTQAGQASSASELRRACLNVKKVNGWIFSTVVKHVNDIPGAGEVYAEGAIKLRHAGAGTPIEVQVNQFAAAMEVVAARSAKGQNSDGSWLPKSSGPLLKACGAYG